MDAQYTHKGGGDRKAFQKGILEAASSYAASSLVSVFLGMFQWTNFWDFVIYFVVAGGVVLFTNCIQFRGKVKLVLGVTAAQAAEVLGIALLVILPFTLQFDSMVQGIALPRIIL